MTTRASKKRVPVFAQKDVEFISQKGYQIWLNQLRRDVEHTERMTEAMARQNKIADAIDIIRRTHHTLRICLETDGIKDQMDAHNVMVVEEALRILELFHDL